MFKLTEKNGVCYYTISSFEETGLVNHCFSTRMGGVSEGYCASMNLRFFEADSDENVLRNFEIISDTIGIDYRKIVHSKQIHEAEVYKASAAECGNGIIRENALTNADALITNERKVPLMTTHADCVPLFFLDKKHSVIALAHSGWRGTVKGIGLNVIRKMKDEYDSDYEDILVGIGPSIQEDCFEVGDEVAEQFIDIFGADTAVRYGEKYHVNMQKAIKKQLMNEGIPETNIDDCGICTSCNSDLLFSHRKTNGKRGNLGAFLELK